MDYFIWDKKSNLLGLTANMLFNSRPDLKYDDVIVIHKEGDPENIVMVETKNELKLTYDIKSDNADVVGFVTAIILAEDDPQTINEKLNNIDKKKEKVEELPQEEEDMLFEYAKLLEDIINKMEPIDPDKIEDDELYNLPVPIKGSYRDPECKIIDLENMDDDIKETKLEIKLKHAFVSELADMTKMRCMEEFNEELKELEDKREQYLHECNSNMVDVYSEKIEAKIAEIMDSCDATITLSVNKIYEYDDVVLADCVNGQTLIIQRDIISSMRTNSFLFNKSVGDDDDKNERHRSFHKTVTITLDECYNEVVERDNTIFVIAI